ncbi:F0F1 ATP synthase subunit delta [Chlorobium sp. KB01]|uniref:F0F1 ATP synthase subunit delta n=1 Tax=Chlorobium sp. KB01 TaxID=1917528 RepID=UPI0009758151|nr:F0F1 ATP synthase subunit delta [Chlorobium sp. KB01]
MSSLIASRRYASALLSSAEEGGFLDTIVEELKQIREVLNNSRDLVHVLRSPLIQGDKKVHILEEIFRDSVGQKMHLFLSLIANKKRAGLLPEIIDEFQVLLDEKQGVLNADVTSAVALSDLQVSDLVSKLTASTGKTIRAKMKVNADLIGGVSVKIGDTILDGSVSHQLEMLKHSLMTDAV